VRAEEFHRRVVEALERSADADEERNKLIKADAAERIAAWAKSEAQTAKVVAAIEGDAPRHMAVMNPEEAERILRGDDADGG
jgi:mono/diheme cytochrome c family protein